MRHAADYLANVTPRDRGRQSRHTPWKVAMVLHEDSSVVREIVEGVTHFALPHRPWLFRRLLPESLDARPLRAWRPDGIIAHTESIPPLTRLGVPVVSVANLSEAAGSRFDKVCVDDDAIAQLAATYFLNAGFTSFGFVGTESYSFSTMRQRAFQEAVEQYGKTVSAKVFESNRPWNRYLSRDRRAEHQLDQWLEKLPRPAAIFAANDELSLPLNEACRRVGLRIPEDVALLGVDNDRLLCELSWPPLSSVIVPTQRIGYEAAALLEARMDGRETGGPVRRLLPPVGIEVRQSSDILALNDAELAAAVRFIRDHASEPIDVGDVLEHVPISRRPLEQRFRNILGRSPLDEIHRVRIDLAQRMLSNTDLSMPEVARRSGLGDNKQMCALFRRMIGMTPTAWRNQSRVRKR